MNVICFIRKAYSKEMKLYIETDRINWYWTKRPSSSLSDFVTAALQMSKIAPSPRKK